MQQCRDYKFVSMKWNKLIKTNYKLVMSFKVVNTLQHTQNRAEIVLGYQT